MVLCLLTQHFFEQIFSASYKNPKNTSIVIFTEILRCLLTHMIKKPFKYFHSYFYGKVGMLCHINIYYCYINKVYCKIIVIIFLSSLLLHPKVLFFILILVFIGILFLQVLSIKNIQKISSIFPT